MPRVPGPALVVGAVALALFLVSAFDAITVVSAVRDEQRAASRSGDGLRAADRLHRELIDAERLGRPRRGTGHMAAVLRRIEEGDPDGDGIPRAVAEVERLVAFDGTPAERPAAIVLHPVMQYTEREAAKQARSRSRIDSMTTHALRSDGAGMGGAFVLALFAVAGIRRRGPGATPAFAPTAPTRVPATATARPPTDLLGADPIDDGPDAREVAAAVDRVRRQVLQRYTTAQKDRDELAGILDTAFDAFIGVDAEGRVTRWNARAERMFGWSYDEAVGESILRRGFADPGDRAPVPPEAMLALATSSSTEPAQFTAWHRTGRSFPVEVALCSTPDGHDAGVYAFVRDISRRRRTERHDRVVHRVTQALAEADGLDDAADDVFAVLCETYAWCAGTIWVRDEDGARLVPLRSSAIETARLRHWTAACDAATFARGAGLPGRSWATGAVASREEAPTADDDPRAAIAARSGLSSAVCLPLIVDGEVTGVVELLGRERLAIDRWMLDDLAAVTAAVASFVERRRVREAHEQARREFLTLVSHELRTPLTSILGYVQMLRGRMDDAGEAERRSLEIIGRNANRLRRLVGDLLFAAEVSRGQLVLEPGEVRVEGIVRDAVDAALPVAQGRGVALAVDIADVPVVEGDPGRLSQVLDNLLSNAIKFSHAGGSVDVRVRPAGESVEIVVADRGIGVAKADLERITQQFFRAATAQAAQVGGMGLGLSLSRAIVEGHGGELRFQSVEGEGTTVTVVLPTALESVLRLAA